MFSIKEIEAKWLSECQLIEMWKVQKDMWAYSLWEYVICNCCNQIHSKNDIFWYLSQEIRRDSVSKLEEIFLWDSIKCKRCNSWNTDFIYDIDKSVSFFIEKYKQEAFLVLWYNLNWEIVGFMDWYFSYLIDIYNLEISYHYPNLSINILEELIKNKLSVLSLDRLLSLSSIWTYENNISYTFIFELIRRFFKIVWNKWWTPWIIELDKRNSIYQIYKIMWSVSLWIDTNISVNTNENYESDLCIFVDPIANFNTNFDMSFRQFFRKYKIK